MYHPHQTDDNYDNDKTSTYLSSPEITPTTYATQHPTHILSPSTNAIDYSILRKLSYPTQNVLSTKNPHNNHYLNPQNDSQTALIHRAANMHHPHDTVFLQMATATNGGFLPSYITNPTTSIFIHKISYYFHSISFNFIQFHSIISYFCFFHTPLKQQNFFTCVTDATGVTYATRETYATGVTYDDVHQMMEIIFQLNNLYILNIDCNYLYIFL